MPDVGEEFRGVLAHHLATLDSSPADRGVITGYYAIVECLGDDGQPYLRFLTDPDMAKWRAVGMLTTALDDVRDSLRDA